MAAALQGSAVRAANAGGDNHLALSRRRGQDLAHPLAEHLARGGRGCRAAGGWGSARLGTIGCALSWVVNAMSEKKGSLRMQSSGRWAVCRPGHDPVEILSGALFRVEIDGELRVTRMEHLWSKGYYSVDGYKLRDGMRAAIGSRD